MGDITNFKSNNTDVGDLYGNWSFIGVTPPGTTVSNYKASNVDLDNILIPLSQKDLVPTEYRNDEIIWPPPPPPSAGTLWVWGSATTNGIATYSSPVQIGSLTDWAKISSSQASVSNTISIIHHMAVKSNGTLWAWGYNGYGELGLNDRTHRSSPVQVGSLTDWKEVAVGDTHSIAVKTDGSLWAWGKNTTGQLGLGDITHRSSPVRVGSLTDWSTVAGTFSGSFAIKTNGGLWSWGANASGVLGHNNTTNLSSPVRVGTLTDWQKIISSGGHRGSAAAIKTDGGLWAWGDNFYGTLGFNDRTHRSSPTRVGTLTDWKEISIANTHSVSVKTNGSLWTWGNNSDGRLGSGNITHRSSPVQVGSLTDWNLIGAAGQYFAFTTPSIGDGVAGFSAAIKTDGSLWTWGANGTGQLASGNVTPRSSPVQVGSLTNWTLISLTNVGSQGGAIINQGGMKAVKYQ
jgi:alpha-tubulin suppressor-like RCC1 family protein